MGRFSYFSRNYGILKKDAPASAIRLALPGLIDLRNPDALDPIEVEKSYWTDPENVKYLPVYWQTHYIQLENMIKEGKSS